MADAGRQDAQLILLLREQNTLLRESLSRQDKSDIHIEAMQADIAEIKSNIKDEKHGERIRVLESETQGMKFWLRTVGVAVVSALATTVFALFRHGGKG